MFYNCPEHIFPTDYKKLRSCQTSEEKYINKNVTADKVILQDLSTDNSVTQTINQGLVWCSGPGFSVQFGQMWHVASKPMEACWALQQPFTLTAI